MALFQLFLARRFLRAVLGVHAFATAAVTRGNRIGIGRDLQVGRADVARQSLRLVFDACAVLRVPAQGAQTEVLRRLLELRLRLIDHVLHVLYVLQADRG